jgi:hypothetical protein
MPRAVGRASLPAIIIIIGAVFKGSSVPAGRDARPTPEKLVIEDEKKPENISGSSNTETKLVSA